MNSDPYLQVLARKEVRAELVGLQSIPTINSSLFGYQAEVLEFLLRAGRGAAFLDTGLGKTLIELEWARIIYEHTNLPVLIFAPLAVGHQHAKEADRFGIDARVVKSDADVCMGINITNYERMHLFDCGRFAGVVLDESSIIKSYTGKTTRALMEFVRSVRYRLAATATPAPNDHMEIGQHSQFLSAMNSNEMLARWFIADQSEMGRYRLKKAGINSFWSWVASWSRCLSKPSDLGYSDDEFILPELREHRHIVEVDVTADTDGMLIRMPVTSATAIHQEKRRTVADRADCIAALVAAEPCEPWVIWCDTDYEADALLERIPDAVEVRGSMPAEKKEERLAGFSDGEIRILITKPSIAGFGLNWQHCARCAFVGLSFSYEQYYQAIRRFWRFGQHRSVEVHIATAETEEAVWRTIRRKAAGHELMKANMYAAMRRATEHRQIKIGYQPREIAHLPEWLRP